MTATRVKIDIGGELLSDPSRPSAEVAESTGSLAGCSEEAVSGNHVATILIVDDRPINREFLVTLLGYFNHEILQASDGAEALTLAAAHHPDLIITDVLMPVMDGVELVNRLHADPAIADIPVIFYTATYRLGDARELARTCGVDSVIGKPASPQTILDAVAAKLGDPAPATLGQLLTAQGLPSLQQHLSDVHEQLSLPSVAGRVPQDVLQQSANAATALSLRLAALLEVGQELATERDLDRLLESYIHAATHIMNVHCAAIGIVDRDGRIGQVTIRGLPESVRPLLIAESSGSVLGQVMAEGKGRRLHSDVAAAHGLPAGHPPVSGLLALPVRSLMRSYGWLYFADKLEGEKFSDEDEQIANILATKLALACENLQLFGDAQHYAADLEIEVAARRDSEARFRELAENIREVFWLVDPAMSTFFYVSPGYEEIWGRSCASLYADPDSWREGVHPDDRMSLQKGLRQMLESGRFDQRFRVLRDDQGERWVRARGFPVWNDRGELLRVAGIAEDVTETTQQQNRIARLNRVLAVLSGINSAIVRIRERPALFDEACRIAVEDGQFALAWIGRTEDGQQLTPLAWRRRDGQTTAPRTLPLVEGEGHAPVLGRGHVTVCNDLRRDCPDDPYLADAANPYVRSRAILSLRENGVTVGAMVLYAEETGFFDADEVRLLNELAGDISFALDYMSREDRLNYLAYYDALTGLPNRSLFVDRVTQSLHAATHDGSLVAVILLDFDHFKRVNDTLGRNGGDELLKQIAKRLNVALQEPFSLARVGGDIFAIALGSLSAHEGAMTVLRGRIFAALVPAFPTESGDVLLSARAGIAVHPGDGDTAEILYAHAEVALRLAKTSGERYAYFDRDINARIVATLALEKELRQALSLGQFVVYFQPKLSLQSGSIVGAEALIRWLHPTRGLIGPADFIPLAEECGLIVPLGEWVLRSVCEQQTRWRAARLDIVPVAVNLSAAQFHAVDVVDMVRKTLAAARLEPKYLELELTESILMRDPEAQAATLTALRQLGVGLALDDFGTGYSSLAYLKRYPFSSVKIDRAFITELVHNPEEAAVVDAAIGISRRLGMKTVAEGVETQGQMHYLHRLGCDEMQGYLFSRPVPLPEFEAMLRRGEHLTLPVPAPAEQRTLLLVDDEPGILAALQRLLLREGYHVLTAGSGREGLDVLAVNTVQVIISDQGMPGMSGTEFLNVAKELYPDTIRIILSGHTELKTVTDAVNQGAVFKFLTKPWDDALLRENVRDAFRQHRTPKEQPIAFTGVGS